MTVSRQNHLRYWLALIHCLTDKNILILLEACQSVEKIFKATPHELANKTGLSSSLLNFQPDWKIVDQQLQWLSETATEMIVWTDPHYPPRLRQITRPPIALFIQGDPTRLLCDQLAMVGSRKPTLNGLTTAKKLASELSKLGLVITSGLALGIDKASHEGALMAKSPTIAILGSGLDIIYPSAHQHLAKEILDKGGALVSEFLPGTPPKAAHFPQRNRIISGLSLGTVVVEATLRSGSLITARYALEQNREVFAIPGSIQSEVSSGCHYLIKQGAKLVENSQDIIDELPGMAASESGTNQPQQYATLKTQKTSYNNKSLLTIEKQLENLEPKEKILINCLTFDSPTPADRIIQHTSLPADYVNAHLAILELQGYIVLIPGGYIKKEP